MEYSVYKMEFYTETHFGKGMLNNSSFAFHADTLFSALYIEALKMQCADSFYEMTRTGKLLFSDALPYLGETYMVPKPVVHVEANDTGNSEAKKRFKKLKYIPADQIGLFLSGKMELSADPMKDFGEFRQRTMAAVRTEGETKPFHVRVHRYKPGNGLYILVKYESEQQKVLMEDLLEALSYYGIGGKKSNGLGRFNLKIGKRSKVFDSCLVQDSSQYLLLSGALPGDDEMEQALTGASYLLERRSGFIFSDSYADEYRKKKDIYVFAAGSCFAYPFEGDIFDVSQGGNHPVYRYEKPLFMGVGG